MNSGFIFELVAEGGAYFRVRLFVRCHLDYGVLYAGNAYFRFSGNNCVVSILRFFTIFRFYVSLLAYLHFPR